MPVSTTNRKKHYTCNGATTLFAFDFPITDEKDLVVQVRTDATGAVTTLTLTTDYTVTKASLNWDHGGNVTTIATYAAGKTLIAFRLTVQDQDMDLEYGDKLDSESLEDSIDKLTMIVQELQEQVDRCIKAPVSDAEGLNMELPTSVDRASKWQGYDALGQPTGVQTTPSSVTVSPYAETLLDDADAATARTTLDVLQDIADVITASHIGDEAISVDHLKADASYKNAVTRYYVVPFGMGQHDGDTNVEYAGDSIAFTANEDIYLPVELPHGAIVTELYSSGDAGDGVALLTIYLKRSPLNATAEETMATTELTSTDAEVTDNTIDNATIDNSAYMYYIHVTRTAHDDNAVLEGIRITYTVLNPLP